MHNLTTTTQAVEFWAKQAAEFDGLLENLDLVLPTTKGVGEDATPPFTEDTRDSVIEALEQARLAADTVLGAYTRVLHQERETPGNNLSPYSPRQY